MDKSLDGLARTDDQSGCWEGLFPHHPIHPMKAFPLVLLTASFGTSAPAATWLYTDSTAFFNSSTWTGASAGSAVTENFVASGGVHNFTGNEQFNSNSYTYGSGSQQNTVTYTRSSGGDIFVDTTNEQGGFLSFDNPGSSKYLYMGPNSEVRITFAQPITSFGFRLGDFGDPGPNDWSLLRVRTDGSKLLAEAYPVNVNRSGGSNNGNSVTLNLSEAFLGTPDVFSAGSTSIIIGDKSWAFMGWTFDSPINEISIVGGSNTDSWGIDTVSFTTVPEPGAALLGGLGMLTLLRRRRP
jgi:MYXO-CTERM domain-containing protein